MKKKAILPENIFLQHMAILGKTGSGKTYTAKGFVEWMLSERRRVCIIDPTGVWWGLRSDAKGKKAAFPVVVFGGEHADMPLLANQGEAMAEIVGSTDMSCVIDTSQMSIADRTRFFIDFAQGLMRKNRGPLHLVIDEAHNFMPQGKVISPQAGMMLAAGNELLSGGRARGLRVMLISQRPQKLHKDSLTQCETLIAMRVVHPLDRRAIAEWIESVDGARDIEGEVLKSLPGMPTGEGWVWSPEVPLIKRMKFPRIDTYDSSAAPDGKASKVILAKVDMPAIEKKLGEYAEQAKANDPKYLRDELARLRRELSQAGHGKADKNEIEAVRKAAYGQGWGEGQADLARKLQKKYAVLLDAVNMSGKWAQEFKRELWAVLPESEGRNRGRPNEKLKKLMNTEAPWEHQPTVTGRIQTKKPNRSQPPRPLNERFESDSYGVNFNKPKPATDLNPGSMKIGEGHRKILIALAQYPQGRTKSQIGILAGYSAKGGSFNTYLSALRTAGYINGRDVIMITVEGEAALGHYDPLPTGNRLRLYWMHQLGKGEAAILKAVCDAYPEAISKEAVGAATGYESAGGSFNTYLSKLRTLELVHGRGELRAADELFDGDE